MLAAERFPHRPHSACPLVAGLLPGRSQRDLAGGDAGARVGR